MTRVSDTIKVPGTTPGGPVGVLVTGPVLTPMGPLRNCKYCGRPIFANGLCGAHNLRRDLGWTEEQMWEPIHPCTREATTYDGTHSQLKNMFGSAKQYRCHTCPERAHDWAYQHNDPNEMVSMRGRTKGLIFGHWQFYAPMCKSCHRAIDGIGVNDDW